MTVLNSKEYKDFENILFLNSDGTQVDDLKTNALSKGKYKASKFYGRFAKMSRDIRATFTLDNKGVANEFYNEEYFSNYGIFCTRHTNVNLSYDIFKNRSVP